MRQKDIKLIARALRDSRPLVVGKPSREQQSGLDVHDNCVVAIADRIASDDPEFRMLEFIIACGVSAERARQ